jgi:hypothetical protein
MPKTADVHCNPSLNHLKLATTGGNSAQLTAALSRALWGSELLSEFLSLKIEQEFQSNYEVSRFQV